MDYYVVSQGKTTIPGVDDGEEFQMTDVRRKKNGFVSIKLSMYILYTYFDVHEHAQL